MQSVQFPQGHVLFRNLNKAYPLCTHGKGVYLFDQSGKKYFDASGGALVTNLGHGNSELLEVFIQQLSKVTYVNGTQFTTPVMEACAEKLSNFAKPLGLNKIALLSSGSEAVEAAIKFARQLWADRGMGSKHKLIARTPGYHGNTLYALSASGRPHYKKVYGPLISPVLTVSTPYGYRAPFVDAATPLDRLKQYDEKGADFYANELQSLIDQEGANTISAFIFETVSGSSTGAWTPPKGYFQRVQEICTKNNILMIADEVMCGAGRTDRFFASEHYDLKPDLVVLGKGLNAGIVPVSAVIVKEEHLETFKRVSGGFMHAQTYMQAPSLAAAALAVLSYFEKHQVLIHAQPIGHYFQEQLQKVISPLETVGSVTGIGHMAGVEFVADKPSRRPFPIAQKFSLKFVQHAQDLGLILWPNYGQADGINGDLVMLGPSLLMTRTEVDDCISLLKSAIETFKL